MKVVSLAVVLAGLVASDASAATWSFGADISSEPELDGVAVAGGTVTVDYDVQRLRVCTAANRGTQSFYTAQYRFDGGPIQSASYQYGAFNIDVPVDAQVLEIWFHNYSIGLHPCDGWDSKYGANYRLELKVAPAEIYFPDDISTAPTVIGDLVTATVIVVDYEFLRLARCTESNRSTQSFYVARYRIDDGPIENKWYDVGPFDIEIPDWGERLELWFHNYSIGQRPCEAWDSRYGQNYVFDLNT